jgi:hypothetical protein
MASATDYLENQLIDHLFRATIFPKPSWFSVGLFTAAPSEAGGVTEPAAGSYARVIYPVGNNDWLATQGGTGTSSGTGGLTRTAAAITFPAPTADWGTVTHLGVFDHGGNLLLQGPLAVPRTIRAGDPAPVIVAGDLTVMVS